MTVTRIPLDVVVSATGHRTPGVVVGVLVAELDALKQEVEQLRAEVRPPSLARMLVRVKNDQGVVHG